MRNAAIVLGNMPHAAATSALIHGLNDAEPLVRSTCAWALGRWDDPAAERALGDRAAVETDAAVQQEIETALRRR